MSWPSQIMFYLVCLLCLIVLISNNSNSALPNSILYTLVWVILWQIMPKNDFQVLPKILTFYFFELYNPLLPGLLHLLSPLVQVVHDSSRVGQFLKRKHGEDGSRNVNQRHPENDLHKSKHVSFESVSSKWSIIPWHSPWI